MVRDLKLVERLSRLHPAVVADCLDRQGLRRQVLAPHILALPLVDPRAGGGDRTAT